MKRSSLLTLIILLTGFNLYTNRPGRWVDVMSEWRPGKLDQSLYRKRLPNSPYVLTLGKGRGGAGGMASRIWRLEIVDPAGPYQEGSWEFELALGGSPDIQEMMSVPGRVVTQRSTCLLESKHSLFEPDPKPEIFYRTTDGRLQLLVYSPPHPESEWNPEPGWWTCYLGDPWRPCDRWGR